MPVQMLVDHLSAGDSLDIFLDDFPSVTREQALAVMANLEGPDSRIDALWAKEAENRIAAYDAGQMEAFDADEVFADETALLSESGLSDWNRPEEDQAWSYLQDEPPTAST